MPQTKRLSEIHKLHIGHKLSLGEIEMALNTATAEAELARVDLMKNETIVFLRGDKSAANHLKTELIKKSPKAKFKIVKTTAIALTKAL